MITSLVANILKDLDLLADTRQRIDNMRPWSRLFDAQYASRRVFLKKDEISKRNVISIFTRSRASTSSASQKLGTRRITNSDIRSTSDERLRTWQNFAALKPR